MDSNHRIDSIAKALAARHTRRTALQTTGAGIAAGPLAAARQELWPRFGHNVESRIAIGSHPRAVA
jgi:hypothetical protein